LVLVSTDNKAEGLEVGEIGGRVGAERSWAQGYVFRQLGLLPECKDSTHHTGEQIRVRWLYHQLEKAAVGTRQGQQQRSQVKVPTRPAW
jgi:hypothetical protein